MPQVVAIKDACVQLGIGRTTLWSLCRSGAFPQPIAITTRRRGFLQSDLDAWLQARASARDLQSR